MEKAGKKLLLSLQAFEQDPYSKNYHVLMDRIGIYIYFPNSRNTADAIDRMLITDIDLPIDEEKLEKLSCLLDKIINCQIQIEKKVKNIDLGADMEIDKDLSVLVPVARSESLLHQFYKMYVEIY